MSTQKKYKLYFLDCPVTAILVKKDELS